MGKGIAAYLKQNILLLLSTGAALCLCLQPSRIVVVLEAAIFCLVAFACWALGPEKPEGGRECALCGLCLAAAGMLTFAGEWRRSSLVAAVAGKLGLPALVPVLALAAAGGLVSLYAFRRLSCRFYEALKAYLPEEGEKADLLTVISGFNFFLAMPERSLEGFCCALAAAGILCLLCRHTASQWQQAAGRSIAAKILTGLTVLGICLFRAGRCQGILGYGLCLIGVPFLYLCVDCFFRWMESALAGAFEDLSRWEALFCMVLTALLGLAVTVIYLNTDAFYGTAHPYDIVYTSDSHLLMDGNVWLNLTHAENDLRQPLYAVFSAPFVAIPWLVSRVLPQSPALEALCMSLGQLPMLLLANFLVARLLGLKGAPRAAFFALECFSYPTLLFSLMMEQYIFVYFYTVLFVWQLCRGKKDAAALWGAGGTLLTSLVLLPVMPDKHPVKAFRGWFREILGCALGFAGMLLVFGRLDIILGAGSALMELGQFTGEKVTTLGKLFQFSAFPAACLWAPEALVTQNQWGVTSWQLAEATGLSLPGLAVLAVAVVSGILFRKELFPRVCLGWLVFSFALLFGLGWGTQENGLILYALYFGWAFWALLGRLVLAIPRKGVTALVFTAAAAGLAVLNLKAMAQLLYFALSHYLV